MEGRRVGGVTPKEDLDLEFSFRRLGVELCCSASGIRPGHLPTDSGLV